MHLLVNPLKYTALALSMSKALGEVQKRYSVQKHYPKCTKVALLFIMHLGGVPWFKATLKAFNLDMHVSVFKLSMKTNINLTNVSDRKALFVALVVGGIASAVVMRAAKWIAGVQDKPVDPSAKA